MMDQSVPSRYNEFNEPNCTIDILDGLMREYNLIAMVMSPMKLINVKSMWMGKIMSQG